MNSLTKYEWLKRGSIPLHTSIKILTLQSQVTVATRTVAISLNSMQRCLLTVVGDNKKVRILLTLGMCRGSCLF